MITFSESVTIANGILAFIYLKNRALSRTFCARYQEFPQYPCQFKKGPDELGPALFFTLVTHNGLPRRGEQASAAAGQPLHRAD
jgi:hypothetical protein